MGSADIDGHVVYKITTKVVSISQLHVFKYRSYYYSGMVRPTDQEMTAIEKIVITHRSHKKGSMVWCFPHHTGNTRVSKEAEK